MLTLGIIGLIASLVVVGMNLYRENFTVVFIFSILTAVNMWTIYDAVHKIGYKDGQINALLGEVHYELVTHSDSTSTWEEIE